MRINPNDDKLTKVIHLLIQNKLDGFAVFSDGSSNILRPSYFQYFSRIKPTGKAAVVISPSGKVAAIVESESDLSCFISKSWMKDIRKSPNIHLDIPKILDEFKIEGTVGCAGIDQVTADMYEAITNAVTPQPADEIIEHIAAEKTPQEIKVVREAARIADRGFETLFKQVRVGIKEYELTAEIGYTMRMAGADDIFILISSEQHNQALHRPMDKRLNLNDTVIVEMAPFVEGQCVQVCRTVYLGKPRVVLAEKYHLLINAFHESLKQIRPGQPASVLSRAMNKIISSAGYEKYCYPPYMRARGHGFGVGSISPGAVIDDNTTVLLSCGQVLIAHPNQYFPETGYLACGETVLVTDNGFKRLLKTETKLYYKEV